MSANYKYTADRWCVYPSASSTRVLKNDNGITVSIKLSQILDTPLVDGEKYTLSASINGVVRVLTFTAGTSSANTYLQYEKHTYDSLSFDKVSVLATHGEQIINWVKLEKGAVNTPFIAKSYDEEFLLCQRYYQKVVTESSIIYDYRETYKTRIRVTFPAMRTAPTIIESNGSTYNNSAGAGLTSTNFELDNSGINYITGKFTFTDLRHQERVTGIYFSMVLDAEIY